MDFTETQWGCTFLLCGYVLFLLLLTTFGMQNHLLQLKNPILRTYMHIALGMTGKVGCRRYSNTLTRCTSTAPTGTSMIGLAGDEWGQVEKNTCSSHSNTQIATRKPTWVHTLSGGKKPAEFTLSSSGESKLFFPSFLTNVFFMQNRWTMLGESVHSKVSQVRKTQAAVTSCWPRAPSFYTVRLVRQSSVTSAS